MIYRKRSEVFLRKDEKFIVGEVVRKGKKYMINAGGAVEEGESLQDAVYRETLEEFGIRVGNLKLVGDIKMSSSMIRRTGEGTHTFIFVGDFLSVDKSLYGSEPDTMAPRLVTKEEYIENISKNYYWPQLNKKRLEILNKL